MKRREERKSSWNWSYIVDFFTPSINHLMTKNKVISNKVSKISKWGTYKIFTIIEKMRAVNMAS